jgi:hypothetical protein
MSRFKHKEARLGVAGGLFLLSGAAFAIARLEQGARAVACEQLYLDEVKEGTLERKVRGPGVLRPRRQDKSSTWLTISLAASAPGARGAVACDRSQAHATSPETATLRR